MSAIASLLEPARQDCASEAAWANDVDPDLVAAVSHGLMRPQKRLPSKYFYDAIGSALFECITLLPEYGLMRAEERILQSHADAIVDGLGNVEEIVELGSGSGRKTRLLLQACARRTATTYYPIEISPSALAQCQRDLADVHGLDVIAIEQEYLPGLQQAMRQRRSAAPLLLLFLGSTIGNFQQHEAAEFLAQLHGLLRPGDGLVLGADLDKPRHLLMDAYDDAQGITAAFNLNLLARLNRELGANFDLRKFRHEARYNPCTNAVEMHLRALEAQQVDIRAADLSIGFQIDETIWTESSHKYTATQICVLGTAAGFTVKGQWFDQAWPFATSLLIA